MKRLNFWSRKLARRALQMAAGRMYANPSPDLSRTILVAGTARSGTTWLGDLIAAQVPCRTLFEPFNPVLVPAYRGFNYFQYQRPGSENTALEAFARSVFTGQVRSRWIDRQNERFFASHRLVKEIRANLMLKWLRDRFPQVPIIFLVRHPCAVVLSRMELDWATDEDIQPLLAQPELVGDFLEPLLGLIHTVKTPEEKHAVIWSASHLAPFRQLKPGDVKLVYYENLVTHPEAELPALFDYIGQPYRPQAPVRAARPSQTSREASAGLTAADRIAQWKKRMKPAQVDAVLRVVEAFQLDHLYGDSTMPLNCDDLLS